MKGSAAKLRQNNIRYFPRNSSQIPFWTYVCKRNNYCPARKQRFSMPETASQTCKIWKICKRFIRTGTCNI